MIGIGRYQGTVVEATLGLDSIGGEQIEILIERDADATNRADRASFVGSFSGDAGPYTLERMILAGYQIGEDPDVMVGKIVEFVVFEELYKNRPRLKVDIVRPLGKLQTPQSRRIEGKKAIDFLTKIAALPRPARKAGHSTIDDDDLPPEAHR